MSQDMIHAGRTEYSVPMGNMEDIVLVRGEGLEIGEINRVARWGAKMRLSRDERIMARIHASSNYVTEAVETGRKIYGITTGFGGMVDVAIPKNEAAELQNNLTWFLKAGAGKRLPLADVRAGMVLRANSLMRGHSGIRFELIKRLETFLNAGVTPLVYDLGSIGASGDLVPLSAIAGAIIGLDRSFKVDFRGEEMDSISALERLGLTRMRLAAKEGLAIMNGTSVLTGIAANCIAETRQLLALSMGVHALVIQGLAAKTQPFEPFIHQQKPHPGQIWTAAQLLDILDGSRMVNGGMGKKGVKGPVQERYSLRCLPQFMGPIMDGLSQVGHQIEVEMNCANDNPLINTDDGKTYHCGNFLGQYVGVGMDQLRNHIGMAAKHIDVQLATLVAPEFSNGLSACMVGNQEREVNMGFKGLQISGNSIMPLLTFYGNSFVDRFPTHAEQYNQNINSLGFGSANLARQSTDLFRQYVAIALMFGVQAVDLRSQLVDGHYDARAGLSPKSRELYEAVRSVVGVAPSENKPYIWNDDEQPFDEHIAEIASDIAAGGSIIQAISPTLSAMEMHFSETSPSPYAVN